MAPTTIELERISKRYRLGERSAKYDTLREAIYRALDVRRRTSAEPTREIWALRDVTLSVDEGEIVGVIGHNGAGKTTLLKVVARITEPTSGRGRVCGRVGSLLDVGTGFHYELTGRENIFLGGTVLGMSRPQIRRRFDEIVEFADVGPFLDTPLKRYSAGMHLRLAFAVAAYLDSDVLVVDEVLAVGDAEFRRKCLGTMSDLGREGRTVLFVSHDLGAVQQLCNRVVWLDRGRIRADGSPGETVEAYTKSFGDAVSEVHFRSEPGEPVQLISVAVTDERGSPLERPRRDQPLAFSIRFRTSMRIPGLDIGIYLFSRGGIRLLDEFFSDVEEFGLDAKEDGEYDMLVTLPPVLPSGDYVLWVWCASRFETYFEREVLTFRLWPRPEDRREAVERSRLLQPPVSWRARSLPGSANRGRYETSRSADDRA
jgi:ABC-type polysaccharide/polyol phosphate transport system ATPase subunit